MISAKGERNMLFLTCAAHRLWQGCLPAGFFWALIASAAAADAPAEGPSAAGVEARVTDGRLTLHADGAPLADVLRAIGAAGGFEVVLRGAFATPVSESFADRPLEDAIRELVEGHSMIVRHGDPDAETGATEVAEIRVLENPDLAAAAETAADERMAVADEDTEEDEDTQEDDGEYALSEREAFRLANRDVPPPTRDDILIELDDPDQARRLAAVPKVGALAPGAAADVLAGVFAAEDDPLVRSRAVAALTRLEGPGARRLLRERALGDQDAELRMQALNALATTDGERSVNLLGQALRDDADPEVRKAAISALQRVGGDWARRPLERAARSRPSVSAKPPSRPSRPGRELRRGRRAGAWRRRAGAWRRRSGAAPPGGAPARDAAQRRGGRAAPLFPGLHHPSWTMGARHGSLAAGRAPRKQSSATSRLRRLSLRAAIAKTAPAFWGSTEAMRMTRITTPRAWLRFAARRLALGLLALAAGPALAVECGDDHHRVARVWTAT